MITQADVDRLVKKLQSLPEIICTRCHGKGFLVVGGVTFCAECGKEYTGGGK